MAAHLEAKSLSSLNFLAANPPQYPVNPTEEPRESLVLYISRVPGTRDIILSTFKPQVKNVTAADVANSLYYVHLELPSDELLVPPAVRDEESGRLSGESTRAAIPRKPLPPKATSPNHAETADPGPVNLARPRGSNPFEGSYPPSYSSTTQQMSSEPSYGSQDPASRPHPNYPLASASINRKPLGPRPIGPPPVPEKDLPPRPNSYLFNTRSNDPQTSQPAAFSTSGEATHIPLPNQHANQHSPSQYPPNRHSPNRHSPIQYSSNQYPPNHYSPADNRSPSPRKSHSRKPSAVPFSLTLIRRDPGSGHQWNVGRVSSLQGNGLLSQAAEADQIPQQIDGPNSQPKIDIHLENSGYAKFRGMPTLASIDALRSSSSTSLPPPPSRGAAQNRTSVDTWGSGPDGPPRPSAEWNIEGGFSRQVVMSYSKSWTSNLKHAFRRRQRPRSVPIADVDYYSHSQSPEPADLLPPPPAPREPGGMHHHTRNGSVASATSVESFASRDGDGGAYNGGAYDAAASPPPPKPLITQPGPGLKPKGYVFMSPWAGRCEFRTGNAGRSLKCRHMLQPGGGPESPVAGVMHGVHDGPPGSKLTSELRFNLPSSDMFATGLTQPREDGESPYTKHRHSRFSRLLKLDKFDVGRQDGSDGEDDIGMGLSLGRERAGGGNRGARAKLGKLIIHDEGLKMLDLVVAANVGVWWVAWEKAF